MKRKAYLGIDIGSISTKGVIIDENNKIFCYTIRIVIILP